jgi:hypothetical protein
LLLEIDVMSRSQQGGDSFLVGSVFAILLQIAASSHRAIDIEMI